MGGEKKMNLKEYTIKAQEILSQAAEIANGEGHQVIETGHLLKALLQEGENISDFLIKKLGVNRAGLETGLDAIILGYPKVEGGDPHISKALGLTLTQAKKTAKEFGDEFVSIEHLFFGLLNSKDQVASLLNDAGFDKEQLRSSIEELRGGTRVTDQTESNQNTRPSKGIPKTSMIWPNQGK